MAKPKFKVTLIYRGIYLHLKYAKVSDLDNHPQFSLRHNGLTVYNSIDPEHFAVVK